MNKQDIDKASAALTGAINYFSPMVIALNKADEVFAVLSNTIKFKESLDKEVAAAKAVLEATNRDIASSKTTAAKEIDANTAAAAAAKAQADKDIADAKAQAEVEVKSIKASVVERTKKAVADSEAKIAQVNAAAKQAQDAYDKEVAVMAAGKASLQADVDALEAKLASLREQAKKFAASLVE
jgi:chromosome segregation ATPase